MAVMTDSSIIESESAGAESEPAPVDLAHLDRITMGDRALQREVLEIFLTQSLTYLDRLKQAAGGRAWREAAHSLKGSASGIGAWQVARQAEAAELIRHAVIGHSHSVAAAVLESEVGRVNGHILRLLRD